MGIYRIVTDLGAPAIAFFLRWRVFKRKEDAARFSERLGLPSAVRSPGKWVWCHAASVGEAMSVLSLIKAIGHSFPGWHILLTTGTVTSANLLSKRLPQGVVHQYAPVDRGIYVERFLDHWRPNLALWVESELWPNMLDSLKDRKIPAVLLNARLSSRSFKRWSCLKGWANSLLGAFSLILAQSAEEQARYAALGATNVKCVGNLKYAAEPLSNDEESLAALKQQIADRPVWLMASTHVGEDDIALAVHKELRSQWPGLLTLIVPRHPSRGRDILESLKSQGVVVACRSVDQTIVKETEIYIADTMGEMGLFYRLASIVCLGGSFTWGGHNPVEPAQLGCALIFGPKMTNFAEMAETFLSRNAAFQVHSLSELVVRVEQLLAAPREVEKVASTAKALVDERKDVLTAIVRCLTPYLGEQA